MLGHRVRRISDDAHDLDPEPRCRRQVDVVEAGAAQGDETRSAALQGFEHPGVGRVVDEDADRIVAGCHPDRLEFERRVEIFQDMSLGDIGGVEELAVVALGAEYGNLHGCVS